MKKYLYPMTAVHVMEAQNFLAASVPTLGPDMPGQGDGGGGNDDPSGDL
ncbi:MAG: hypothetical protein II970_03490 [Paludibacteraceae bacterium]|nr:hypothetical protein [Paludibacteraceae bacterium]